MFGAVHCCDWWTWLGPFHAVSNQFIAEWFHNVRAEVNSRLWEGVLGEMIALPLAPTWGDPLNESHSRACGDGWCHELSANVLCSKHTERGLRYVVAMFGAGSIWSIME